MKKAILIFLCFGHIITSAQWQDFSLDIDNNLNAVQFIDSEHGWIGGDDRAILKYSEKTWSIYPTGTYSSGLDTSIPDIEKEAIMIYPNPFQDYVIIESAIELSFSNLLRMYLLKIKTEDSEFIQKVIKN